MELEGHSAVVTGGAKGLGEATSRALAAAGVKVAIFDLDTAKGEALAAEIGGIQCTVDVGDSASVAEGFAMARAAHGQERILVNCAGIGIVGKTASKSRKTGEVTHLPFADYEKVLRVNLLGSFYCIALSAAGMLTLDALEDNERGVIVNTSSIAAVEGQAGQVSYSASKGGISGMTLPIARDLQFNGIRCNAILPGSFDTPLLATAQPAVLQGLIDITPFPKRLGKPSEFARLALELCRNSYINGENIRIDAAARL